MESFFCKFCNNPICEGEGTIMIQSTDCFHTVHEECFKKAAKQALITNTNLFCPECGVKEISNAEVKNYLSPEEIKEIEQS